jgi:hypothetical protein
MPRYLVYQLSITNYTQEGNKLDFLRNFYNLYLARLSFRILESKPLGLQTFQFGLQIILN